MLAQTLCHEPIITPAVGARLRIWLQRARTRRALNELDARGLADIGLTDADRQRECARWFWQGGEAGAP